MYIRPMAVVRWILAIVAFVYCARHFGKISSADGMLSGAAPAIFGFGALIAGVLLITPDVVVPLAALFGRMVSGIIMPGGTADKPSLSYLLARRFRDQMRMEEAIAEYEKIIRHYPREETAYLELLAIAAEADEKVFRRYLKKFKRQFGRLPSSVS